MSDLWPTELRVSKDRQRLVVTFNDGAAFDLSAELLRVLSPSAEVQGHSPDERKTVPGKRNVAILEILPVGNYAVRLVFDDMHSTGIFGWGYLAELGRNRAKYWQEYLDELASKNLTRDPPARRKS
jgi:DUF971 family protein